MKIKRAARVTSDFEAALRAAGRHRYVLRLYVTGATPRSTQAIENITRICREHLLGRYQLEVIDVFQRPVLAKGEQIIAAPTLIKLLPLPLRRFIGDMSSADKILLGLDVRSKQSRPAPRRPSKQGRHRAKPLPHGDAQEPNSDTAAA